MEAIKKILRLENMLSICIFFLTSELKYAYKLYAYIKKVCSWGTKILINFVNVCSKSTLTILFKFDTGFFSCCSFTSLANIG